MVVVNCGQMVASIYVRDWMKVDECEIHKRKNNKYIIVHIKNVFYKTDRQKKQTFGLRLNQVWLLLSYRNDHRKEKHATTGSHILCRGIEQKLTIFRNSCRAPSTNVWVLKEELDILGKAPFCLFCRDVRGKISCHSHIRAVNMELEPGNDELSLA